MHETKVDERSIERAAKTAAFDVDDELVEQLTEYAHANWWPRWKRGNVKRRICNQLDPNDGSNPLQARLWFAIHEMKGDEEMSGQVEVAGSEGRRKRAERDHQRTLEELEFTRTRMRKARNHRHERETDRWAS